MKSNKTYQVKFGLFINTWHMDGTPVYDNVITIRSNSLEYIAKRLKEVYGQFNLDIGNVVIVEDYNGNYGIF